MRKLLIALLSISLCACSTNTPGGRQLYDDSEPPKAKPAEIRMVTIRRLKGEKKPDIRIITCKNGKVTARYSSPVRKIEGSGEISFGDYADLWDEIFDLGGFSAKSDDPDPSGGYFHRISYQLGNRHGNTTAQNKANFIGFGTVEIQARLSLANHITRLIEENCEMKPLPEDTEKKAK